VALRAQLCEAVRGRCCGCPALRSLLDLVCAAGALAGSSLGCAGREGLAASDGISADGAAAPRSCAAPAWRLVNCIGLGCVRRAGGPRAGEGRWRRVGDGWAWCPRRSGCTLCDRIQDGYRLRAVAGRRVHGRRVGDGWAWCPRRSGCTLCARMQGGYRLRAVAGRRVHGRRSCGRRWVTGREQLRVVSPSRLAPAQPFPNVPATIAGLHIGDCTERGVGKRSDAARARGRSGG
jgi:hypothetical protein